MPSPSPAPWRGRVISWAIAAATLAAAWPLAARAQSAPPPEALPPDGPPLMPPDGAPPTPPVAAPSLGVAPTTNAPVSPPADGNAVETPAPSVVAAPQPGALQPGALAQPGAPPPPGVGATALPVSEPLAGFSDGTPFLRSPDGDFVIFPGARLQVDGYFFHSKDKTPNNTFLLRSARLELGGWIGRFVYFFVSG